MRLVRFKNNFFISLITDLDVKLIGGSNSKEGNVYAKNLVTGLYGPVCDDNWTIENVSQFNRKN